MKRATKILVYLLVICQLLAVFAGCKDKKKEEDTNQAEAPFVLTLELLKSYVIVVDRNGGSELREVATSLQKSIEQKTGTKLSIKDDYIVAGSPTFSEAEYEILIGRADRGASKDFYSGLRIKDHGYALVGKKLLILGYDAEYASKSAIRFQSDVLRNASDPNAALLTAGDVKTVAGSYKYDSLTVNGVDISKYSIVYPEIFSKGERDSAGYLQEWIASQTGYSIPVVSDFNAVSEHEIQIGDTNRVTDADRAARSAEGFAENTAYVGIRDNGLWVSGNDRAGIYQGLKKLMNLAVTADKALVLDVSTPVLQQIQSFALSVMSYNVYFDLSESQRNPNDVITSIQQKSPDVFGLNESGADWLKKIDNAMSDVYACAKGLALENSDDSSYNAIYFKKDKFELVESGTKWLSATPDRLSKYPEAKHYKGMTYAILKDKATGAEFMYLNVHLDGSNDSTAHSALKEVRVRQAEVVKQFIAKYPMYPIVMGGDFNEGVGSTVVKGFSQNGRFRYCGTEAKEKILVNSTNVNSSYTALQSSVLDYLFVTADSVSVKKYQQYDNKINGKYPSDHLPVYAELTIFY